LQFQHDGRDFRTTIKDGASLKATFDEVFLLDNIKESTKNGEALLIEAYDKDLGSSQILGTANAIRWPHLVADEALHLHDLELFHEYKRVGNVKFSTRFVWQEPER
jgi:hypothetical protein